MPTTPRKPQDRKPKAAAKNAPVTFKGADGKTHTLPPPTDALEHMTGRDIRDALMSPDKAQEMALGFRILERCQPAQEVLDALYDLPAPETFQIIGRWMPSPNPEGVTLPQS